MELDPRTICPTEGRVLLEQIDNPEKKGELYLTDRTRGRSSRARVIFAPEFLEQDGIREGMQVLCSRQTGHTIEIEGKKYQIVDLEQILAELEEQ